MVGRTGPEGKLDAAANVSRGGKDSSSKQAEVNSVSMSEGVHESVSVEEKIEEAHPARPDGKNPNAAVRPDWALVGKCPRFTFHSMQSYVVEIFWNPSS